jgi:predicted nucleic acid-binding Zn ribbon protein
MEAKPNRGGKVSTSRSGFSPSQPEKLGEILSRLFAARGWGRRHERVQLEEAWMEAAGKSAAIHTGVGSLRRGVLEIVVDSAVLLQELAHFHKRSLLERLRTRLPGIVINDLRFRAGPVNSDRQGTEESSRNGKPASSRKDRQV